MSRLYQKLARCPPLAGYLRHDAQQMLLRMPRRATPCKHAGRYRDCLRLVVVDWQIITHVEAIEIREGASEGDVIYAARDHFQRGKNWQARKAARRLLRDSARMHQCAREVYSCDKLLSRDAISSRKPILGLVCVNVFYGRAKRSAPPMRSPRESAGVPIVPAICRARG